MYTAHLQQPQQQRPRGQEPHSMSLAQPSLPAAPARPGHCLPVARRPDSHHHAVAPQHGCRPVYCTDAHLVCGSLVVPGVCPQLTHACYGHPLPPRCCCWYPCRPTRHDAQWPTLLRPPAPWRPTTSTRRPHGGTPWPGAAPTHGTTTWGEPSPGWYTSQHHRVIRRASWPAGIAAAGMTQDGFLASKQRSITG
jgi:hypothetical protein